MKIKSQQEILAGNLKNKKIKIVTGILFLNFFAYYKHTLNCLLRALRQAFPQARGKLKSI